MPNSVLNEVGEGPQRRGGQWSIKKERKTCPASRLRLCEVLGGAWRAGPLVAVGKRWAVPDRCTLAFHVRALREQRASVFEAMVAAIEHEVPGYGAFRSESERAEWAAGVGELLDLFLDVVEQGRWLTPVEMRAIDARGGERLDQDFAWRDVLASVRVGAQVVRARIVRAFRSTGAEEAAVLDELLALLQRYADEVEDLLGDGYRRRQQERKRSGDQDRAVLVDDILSGRIGSDADIRRRIRSLGCDPEIARCAFLVRDSKIAFDIATCAARELSDVHVFDRRPSDAGGPHALLMVALPVPDGAASVIDVLQRQATDRGVILLNLGVCVGANELHSRYVAALPALPYLDRLARGRTVVDAVDVRLYAVAAALPAPLRAVLREAVFGSIDRCDDKQLAKQRDLLEAHTRLGFSATAVREEMGVNKKTIYAQRRGFTTCTGYSFGDHADTVLLSLTYCAEFLDSSG